MSDRRVPLGVLLKPHGLRGAVRIRLHDPSSETLRKGLACELERDGTVLRAATVADVRGAGATTTVQFAGVGSLEEAEGLRGLTLVVRREDLPELEEGEFYVEDVVGAEVFERSADGSLSLRGKVVAFERYPSTDVFTVALEEGGRVDVPLLDAFVESVDPGGARVVLRAGAIAEATP